MKHGESGGIFSGQRVWRRKGSSSFFHRPGAGKPAYRPAGYVRFPGRNRNFIEVVRQNPSRPVRVRPAKKSAPFTLFRQDRPYFHRSPKKAPKTKPRNPAPAPAPSQEQIAAEEFLRSFPDLVDTPAPKKESRREKRALRRLLKGKPVPGYPLVPAIALGGLLVFSFLCLNWGAGTRANTPVSQLEPGGEPLIQCTMARYAGLNPPAAPEALIPLDIPETFSWEFYTVQKGDSISKIAADFSISIDAVIASNGITNARLLREGEVLRIPNMTGIPYTVKKGDALSRISSGLGVPVGAILDANDLDSDNLQEGTVLFIPGARMRTEDLRQVLGELFIYPVRDARLTSAFGWRNDPISGVRRYHAALDLAASTGTTVVAAMEGTVAQVGSNLVFGNYIILEHTGGYQTMYAHLSKTSVARGAAVRQGLKIGEVGSTGYSTGPHLHFAVFKNGRAVNPLDFLH